MKKNTNRIALIIFLLGIFMGAIDTGIVSPARTVIKNSFGVGESIGVWMITIYTLAYAVAMPIVSKLSDRFGRKRVYIISITIFTIGSALCGLTNFYGNFTLFLLARVVQAIGGGGIIPIATAFIGQSFPPEKRGTALGMVGAMYGIATILGPTMGSGILDAAGANHWGWLFFINVPIGIFIIILGTSLEESKAEIQSKMDVLGAGVISIVILSLMYALTNMDFYNFRESIAKNNVWPYLLVFVITLPIFILVEKKAEDPVLNLSYFKDKQIALTLIISFIVGCGLMGVVFVPQFAENTLKLKTGNGGYLVTLMAVFSGITAPLGGKFIDKYSAKLVMGMGFACTTIGTLFLALYVVKHPSFIAILIGLAFIGFGMGFTMGTPLNYLMLTYVRPEESATALSTLSLIRSVGVTISPNIMVNFIAEAGKQMPDKLRAALPAVKPPVISGFENLSDKFDGSKVNFSGNVSTDMINKFKDADVTTVVDTTKDFVSNMFSNIIPKIQDNIYTGMNSGITKMEAAKAKLITAQSGIDKGMHGVNNGIHGIDKAIAGIEKGIHGIAKVLDGLHQGVDGIAKGLKGMFTAKTQIIAAMNKAPSMNGSGQMPGNIQGAGIPGGMPSGIQTGAMPPQGVPTGSITGNMPDIKAVMQSQLDNINNKIVQLTDKMHSMQSNIDALQAKQHIMQNKVHTLYIKEHALQSQLHTMAQKKAEIGSAIDSLNANIHSIQTSKAQIPGILQNWRADYINQIEGKRHVFENIFQSTLNDGFRKMFIAAAIIAGVGLILTLLLSNKKSAKSAE